MNYNEFTKRIFNIKRFGKSPNLLVVSEMLEKLGNPHKNLKFIHIAGTNGKGSLSNYISSSLCDAGYKTGLFTSPYILSFNERFKINNINIDDETLAKIGTKVFEIADSIEYDVKQFDIITVIGIYYFYLEKCDYVVLEAGMGGRNDSTNVITPVISAITTIDYDHTAILGDTLEKIAYEKSGIIKEGVPLCYYPTKDSNIERIITDECEKKNVKAFTLTDVDIKKITDFGTEFIYEGERYSINMLGEHQVYNACLAITVLKKLGIEYKNISNGLKNMKLIGRFEKIGDNIYIDGGHNPQGAKSIVNTVDYHNIKNPVFIVSMVKDKDMKTYLEIIKEKGRVILTLFDESLCHNPNEFKDLEYMNFDDAVRMAKNDKSDVNYIFCGSLYQIVLVMTKLDEIR